MKAAQLRQAILQAAVQGKLVLQNPQDEPASELLKRIQTEKSHRIKNGKIKKEKPLPSISEEEKPYDPPEGWEWCRLSNICEYIQRGRSPKYSEIEQISVLSQKCVQWGSVSLEKAKFIEPGSLGLYGEERYVKNGDLLWNSTGHGTLGRIALVENIYIKYQVVVADSHVTLIRMLHNFINAKYILTWFSSPCVQNEIIEKSSGSTNQIELATSTIKNYCVPLPPLAEQQRIVAKVDELMTLCDELEAAEKEFDSLEANLAEYLPKSILQAAMQGKLVPQNIHDEPASELLKRIQAGKFRLTKSGKLKKEKPLPPISEEEKPYDLPPSWEWCRIGDICSINPRNKLQDDAQVSFVPMTLISNDYFGGHQQETRKWGEVKQGFTHFAEDDVVLAKITPCFQNAKSCIVKNLKNGFGAGTTELHVLRSLGILPGYLLAFLKNPEFLSDGEKNMTGTAGQQRVPTDYLKNTLFPLPPFVEQQRIVAKIDELMALCDQLKNIDPASVLPQVDRQKLLSSVVMPEPVEAEEQYAMAARGDVSAIETEEHRQAMQDLFGDGADG